MNISKGSLRSSRNVLRASIASLLALTASGLGVDNFWTGAINNDWNNPGNWSEGRVPVKVDGNNFDDALINTLTNFPVITGDLAATPRDIIVGRGGATNGRVDQIAGNVSTGSGNYLYVGQDGGTGTYNLANTAITGPGITGFGAGLGSLNVQQLRVGQGTGGNGTMNINTSGTITVANDIFIGQGGTGVVKMEFGTINRTGGWTVIGHNAGGNGTFEMSGGTVTGPDRTIVGLATGTGKMTVSGGTYNVGSEYWVGNDAGSNGTAIISGGTVNVNTWFAVGRAGSTGSLTISGNAIVNQGMTDAGSRLELTNFGAGGTATVNFDGGVLTTNGINHNGGGTGVSTFNFNGGVLKARANNGGFMGGITVANVRNGGAIIDSNGANITVGQVLQHSNLVGDNAIDGGLTKIGSGTLTIAGANTFTGPVNVNAGTLYANPGNAATNRAFSFVSSITVASDATLRTGANGLFGWDGTQEKPILVNQGGTLVVDGGADVGVGVVTLAGGTLASLGAHQAWGTWRFDNGPDKLIVTENSIASAVNVKFANGAAIDVAAGKNLSFSGTITDTDNGGGSTVIKSGGSGTLNFSNTNTYTGSTTVNAGSVVLSGTGSINNSSGITIDGAGAKLVQLSSTATTPIVTLANGSLDGTGSITTVNVANLAANTISNGNGAAGVPLTIGSLTFAGSGKVNLLLNNINAGLQTTTLTTSGVASGVTIDASNAVWNSGSTYDLISYTTFNGVLTDFTKGVITGLGARQTATLGNSSTAITLAITGELPVWSGIGDDTWTTAVQGTKNWVLQPGGTPTDFLVNDAVLFDDTASGGTNVPVNIIANVAPASTTFSISSKTYTVTGNAGVGITSGTLTKNGNGILNLGGAHTYTGATSLNGGTTNLTGTLGDTPVTVASGATLSVQLGGAISQNTVTVNGTLTQNVANGLSGTAKVVLNNGGTLTHANNHSGGTALNSGLLIVNAAAGLGVGTFTVAGGTIDNTSAGPVTLTNNNAISLLGDLTFTGTQPLDLGTGTVTVGSATSPQTISINNYSTLPGTSLTIPNPVTGGTGDAKTLNINGPGSTLFSGNITNGAALGLVINDNIAGTLNLTGAASSISRLNMNGGAGSIVELGAGNLTLSNGGGDILQAVNGGTINGTGGGSVVIGSIGGDFGTAGGTTLTVNAKLAGTNRIDFYNSSGGTGMGTIILNAANTLSGGMNVENTKVIIPTGGVINSQNTAGGAVAVGTVTNAPATLEVSGGTINANAGGGSFVVGSASGADARLIMSKGVVNASSEFWVGNNGGATGTFELSGGAVTAGSWLAVGRNLATGTVNLSGGTLTKAGGGGTYVVIGSVGGTGIVNQTGGELNATAGGIRMGELGGTTPSQNTVWNMQAGTSTVNGEINVGWRSSHATWNVSGTATVNATGRLVVGAETWNTAANGGLVSNGNPIGTVNISGGSVTFTGQDSRIGGDQAMTNGNSAAGAQGFVNVSGGSLNFGGNLQIGANGQGTMTISGTGLVNSYQGYPVVGRYAGSIGELNVDGGTFTQGGANNFLIIGEEGSGTLNLESGLVDVHNLRIGLLAGSSGTVNLNGGTLATNFIQKGDASSTAMLRFNGGTLKAKADSGDLLAGLAPAAINVDGGGAVFDTDGFNVTVTQGLAPGTGTGGLTKKGLGTLNLEGVNTYTGATVVETGRLNVNGALSGSAVTVNAGASVGGTGTFGALNIATGGSLAPGNSIGVVNTGNLSFLTDSVLAIEINTDFGTSDRVNASALTLAVDNVQLTLMDLGGNVGLSQGTILTLVDYADGGLTGGLFEIGGNPILDDTSFVFGANVFRLSYNGADNATSAVILEAIPEPGSAALLLGGFGILVGARRKRRAS